MLIVAKMKLRLISSIPAEDAKEEAIKEYHSFWRKTNSNSNVPFVPVFNAFKEKHLATLEPGALRLYLFFAFAANNQYGNSWHSIEKIAEFFGAQTRTVNNWIKVLVDKKLIHREQNGKRSHTTYLIPYSDTIIKHQLRRIIREDNQSVLDLFIQKISQYDFYGTIVGVFHFFQWKSEKKVRTKENVQHLFIITKRDDGVLVGHNYALKNSGHLGVSELTIEDGDVATFKSPFTYEGENIRGLVLTHEVRITDINTGVILDVVRDLARAEEWDWQAHPEFRYGRIEDFFPEKEEMSDAEADTGKNTEKD
jgi:hypothetical protein